MVFIIGIFLFDIIFSNQLLLGQIQISFESDTSEQSNYDLLIDQIKKVDYATQCAQNAVNAFADSAFLPDLLFQLSEWEVQRAKLHYELAMMKYDNQMALLDTSKSKVEPVEPSLNYENALEINKKIIENYPGFPYMNKVLYRSGLCLFETGQQDSAKNIFIKLITEYPDTTNRADALFRLGECYFNEGKFEKAIEVYQQILPEWKSTFFPMALYKIAWSHYRLNNYSDAISTFYYLLNDIKTLENIKSDQLGKTQVQLKDEIMEYITMSFSDFGGAQSLYNFIESTGGSAYTPDLLHKLGKIYINRDFYEDAIKTLNLLIQKFPTYKKLPDIFLISFQCYESNGDLNAAYKVHDQIIEYCGPKSRWYQLHKNEEDLKLFKSALDSIDFRIATPLLYTADSLYATKNYKEGVEKYSQFLRLFEKDARADHALYFLAECYYNLVDYQNAANTYKTILQNFPESELREDAAYNEIVCYDQIISQSKSILDDSTITFKNSNELKNLFRACSNFMKLFPNSSKETELKLKIAEIFFRKNAYSPAEKFAKSALKTITENKTGLEYKTKALTLLAQISFKLGKYLEVEKYSNMLIKENPTSTELVETSNKMLASTSFKIGELLKSRGENDLAATKFELAALKSSDPKIAEASLFEAAIQYEEAKQFNKAVIKFENLYKQYPKSPHAKEAIYRAALLRDKLGHYPVSARNYLILHDLTRSTPEGSAALFNAGLAYEKARDWFSMAETFKKYVAIYSNNNDNILEAMFKIAFALEQKKSIPQANLEYQNIINKYNQLKAAGKSADDYFAAQATFRLAEIKHDQFNKIKITLPFQANLKKKQESFNDLLKSYVEVASFNIADWSTAAFYQLGLAYEEFSKDIMESPAPSNLRGADLVTYRKSINEELVVPLQREALKYYKTNERLSAENSLDNEWIHKTRARILFLSKRLGDSASSNNQLKEVDVTAKPPSAQEKE